MRIVFVGKFDYGAKCLESLIRENKNVVAVVTEWRDSFTHNKVIDIAKKENIKLFVIDKVDDKLIHDLNIISPDIVFLASFGIILPKMFLDIPKKGCVNIHPSLLPKYRGPTPIYQAILNNETEIGVTSLFITEGIDSGNIIHQRKLYIGKDELLDSILERVAVLASQVLLETVVLFEQNESIEGVKQDEDKSSYYNRIRRDQVKRF